MSQPPQQQRQEVSRQDQIVYRFYVKTVGVLVDGRLSVPEAAVKGKGGDLKVDKWFNLPLPDPDLFRADLALYKQLSITYPSFGLTPTPSSPTDHIPPLLIAFTLDFSDLSRSPEDGRRLMYRSPSGRDISLDQTSLEELAMRRAKGKLDRSRAVTQIKGVILEQWTLTCVSPLLPPTPAATLPPSRPGTTSTSTSTSSLTSSASVTSLPTSSSSSSPRHPSHPSTYQPPSSATAYKSGIVHFRAVYQMLRTLPAFDLSKRLRERSSGRAGDMGGLKMGVKIWSADGWGMEEDSPSGSGIGEAGSGSSGSVGSGKRTLNRAWRKMEDGLIPIDLDLDAESSGSSRRRSSHTEDFAFPPVPLSNGIFKLSIKSRSSLDFWVDSPYYAQPRAQDEDDIEPALDLEEEFFTPTLARKRLSEKDDEIFRPSSVPTGGLAAAWQAHVHRGGLSATRPSNLEADTRKFPSQISDKRATDSPRSGLSSPTGPMASSPSSLPLSTSREGGTSSGSLKRWGLGEGGLPFAVQAREGERLRTGSFGDRSSPIPTGSYARRVSIQSNPRTRPGFFDQPSTSSPSSPNPTSRNTPPTPSFIRPGNSFEPRPTLSSLPRASSLLSQSGRSFTQLSEARARLQDYSPGVPQPGSSGSFKSPSPISGSFSRQAIAPVTPISSLPRPPLASHPPSPAPLPSFAEEQGSESEATAGPSRTAGVGESPRATPQMIKRYSSSFGQRTRSGSGPGLIAGSSGSSIGDQGSMLGRSGGSGLGTGYGSLRRMSGKGSYEGLSGLGLPLPARTAMGASQSGKASGGSIAPPDGDDINLFLKTLDALPRPPSLAVSRSPSQHQPITSSLLSSPANAPSGTSTPARSSPSSGSPSAAESFTLPMTSSAMMRKPLTRTQVDDTLRRMAGSYTFAGPPFPQPSSGAGSTTIESGQRSPTVSITRRPSGSSRIQSFTPSAADESQTPLDSITPPRSSLTNRDVSSLVSRSASVKSSSPLAGAPLFAPPPSAPPSPARLPQAGSSPSPSRSPVHGLLHSPGKVLGGLPVGRATRDLSGVVGIQSLPSGGGGLLGEELPPGQSSAGGRPRKSSQPEEFIAPLSPALGAVGMDPVGSRPSSTERERRRAPVLLRGGFGNFGSSPVLPAGGGRRDSSPAAPGLGVSYGGGEYTGRAPFTAPGSVSSSSRDRDRTPVRGGNGDSDAVLKREIVGSLGSMGGNGVGRRGMSEGPGSPTHGGVGAWTNKGVGSASSANSTAAVTPVLGGRSGLPLVGGGAMTGSGDVGGQPWTTSSTGSGIQRPVPLSPRRTTTSGYTIGNTHIDPRARWAENRSNSTSSSNSPWDGVGEGERVVVTSEEESGIGSSGTGDGGEGGEPVEVVGPQREVDDGDEGIVGSMEMSEVRRGGYRYNA